MQEPQRPQPDHQSRVTADGVPNPHLEAGERLLRQIQVYRSAAGVMAAPAILAELQPEIEAITRRLHAVPPLIDAEDIRQQLTLEVLEAARSMRLSADIGWLRLNLVLRATGSVVRWLNREYRTRPISLDALADELVRVAPRPIAHVDDPAEFEIDSPAKVLAVRVTTPVTENQRQALQRSYEAARKRRWRARRERRQRMRTPAPDHVS